MPGRLIVVTFNYFFFFLLEYVSAIRKGILFCHESWSWEVRIGVDAWPIFPRKMEEVFQKSSLRLWSLVECEKIFSEFHKLEDYFGRFQRKREISKFRDVSEVETIIKRNLPDIQEFYQKIQNSNDFKFCEKIVEISIVIRSKNFSDQRFGVSFSLFIHNYIFSNIHFNIYDNWKFLWKSSHVHIRNTHIYIYIFKSIIGSIYFEWLFLFETYI